MCVLHAGTQCHMLIVSTLASTGVRAELGQEAVEEACEAIILLHEQNNQSARYWSCPTCDQKFNSGREYLAHIELAHEELAVQVGSIVNLCVGVCRLIGMLLYRATPPRVACLMVQPQCCML
jgi:hypothetical protein